MFMNRKEQQETSSSLNQKLINDLQMEKENCSKKINDMQSRYRKIYKVFLIINNAFYFMKTGDCDGNKIWPPRLNTGYFLI